MDDRSKIECFASPSYAFLNILHLSCLLIPRMQANRKIVEDVGAINMTSRSEGECFTVNVHSFIEFVCRLNLLNRGLQVARDIQNGQML